MTNPIMAAAGAPFTREEFLAVFRSYNEAVWPAQVLLLGAALLALWVVWSRKADGVRWLGSILAGLWIWMGAVYHLAFFSAINPAAVAFGGLFILQGLMFLTWALRAGATAVTPGSDRFGSSGAVFIVYALVVYPLVGLAVGHRYPDAPTFGLPCPTTMFTFGVLLWSGVRVPALLLIIPALWSLLGLSAALSFGMVEDLALPVVGLAGAALLLARNRSIPGSRRPAPHVPAIDVSPAPRQRVP